MHDYAKIDQESTFCWRDERLERAKELGYDYISESIVKTYRKTKSGRKTGKILCGLSDINIRWFLNKIGEPVRGPGGPNRKKRNGGQK